MSYEPFYNTGTFINNELGFYLGYSSIKGSFSDCLPIYNENKNIVVFFAGECLMDRSVINQLRSRGHIFASEGARYLPHLYEEEGERFFDVLNGWYSGLILDLERKRAYLFNDRYGMQKIYFYESDNTFYFSSEVKALLRVLPQLRVLDPRSIGDYLAYDCIFDNRCYFKGVSLLPPGSRWTFIHRENRKEYSFDPKQLENLAFINETRYFTELVLTFQKIMPRYFEGENVGLALTGGQDTRLIFALQNPNPLELRCFTFGGIYRETRDIEIARKIANQFGQNYRAIRLSQQFLRDFAAHAEKAIYLTDGQSDVLTVHETYLNNIVREFISIKVTGKFGSQVMGAAHPLEKQRPPVPELVHADYQPFVSEAILSFKNIIQEHALTRLLFKEIPWFWARYTAAELSQLMVRSPFMDNELIHLLYRTPKELVFSRDFHFKIINEVNPSLNKIMTNLGRYGARTPFYLKPFEILVRNTELLDRWLNASSLRYDLHHWLPKLESVLYYAQLEPLYFDRSQFVHYRRWFARELSEYVQDTLLSQRALQRPYINRDFVGRMVRDHIKGRKNYLKEINKIMTLELIQKTFIERY